MVSGGLTGDFGAKTGGFGVDPLTIGMGVLGGAGSLFSGMFGGDEEPSGGGGKYPFIYKNPEAIPLLALMYSRMKTPKMRLAQLPTTSFQSPAASLAQARG